MATMSEAFAAQADADRLAYELLAGSGLPANHRLHYLQMWLEKLCKAQLWLGDDQGDRHSHQVVRKVLPVILSRRSDLRWPAHMRSKDIRSVIDRYSREVDLLHPQVDDGGRRPDNVEYPWSDCHGDAQVPSEWPFPLQKMLQETAGRNFLKAAVLLTRERNERR